MSEESDPLVFALSKAAIQRALMRDLPGSLYGETMDVAWAGGLILQEKWRARIGPRHFRAVLGRTDRWALAVQAITEARRGKNMSVDPLEIGSHTVRDNRRSYRQWKQVWPEGESPTTLKEVASIAARLIRERERA